MKPKQAKAAAAVNKGGKSGRLVTQHQRLYQALNLGTRLHDGKSWKWQSTDIEIQRHVVCSITSFLDCVYGDTSDHSLVKGSVADMVGALLWILNYKNAAVLIMAANAVLDLIRSMPSSMLQSHVLDLVDPLSSLLSSCQLNVSIPCATALNIILSNLSVKDEKNIWKIINEQEVGSQLIHSVWGFSSGNLPVEYFKEMASLLSTVLHRWPSSRYAVWSDPKLMELLKILSGEPENSLAIAVLKVYSAIALCGNGAKKLLDNGELLLQMTVQYMGHSYPLSVRIEGFRLAGCLVTNEQGCLTVMRCCCEPFVEAIINGMSGWTLKSGKVANEEMVLLIEASRLALVLRWVGKHHYYFWKHRIDRILINLLLENFHDEPFQQPLSFEEQISKAKECLRNNYLLTLRPYIWDILGWLVAHCSHDFKPGMNGHIDILIICACLSFTDSVCRGHEDLVSAFRSESALRVALMMIYSPCKYTASKVLSIMSEILKPTGKIYLKRILSNLNVQSLGDDFGMPEALQAGINLMALACYSALPEYKNHIIESGGIKTLIRFMRYCLNNNVRIGRMSFAPHFRNKFIEKMCCLVNEDWEGDDVLVFYTFMGLAELLHSGSVANFADILSGEVEYSKYQFTGTLQEICYGSYAPGVKWYAAHILGYFGKYGFPSKLGNCMGKAFNEDAYMDLLLILPKGNSIGVHGVVLACRCPLLLPHEALPLNEKASDSLITQESQRRHGKSHHHIRLSSHVNNEALTKLLEFLYLGYLHCGEELVKKLKVLARHCSLHYLLMVLGRGYPKWGTLWPSFDLSVALGPAGHQFSDIILEAKSTESICWTCNICSVEVPHVHAHRVVLWARCDYMRALLESGMQESHSQTIKVPVSWEAVSKVVKWFYTDELPCPPMGCLWESMVSEERLQVLQPYIEIWWLAGFWFLDEIKDISCKVVLSCLDSSRHLSIKVISIAASFSLWNLVEVAASYLAPSFRQLCHSGLLEGLDEELVEMIHAASVRLSQEQQ